MTEHAAGTAQFIENIMLLAAVVLGSILSNITQHLQYKRDLKKARNDRALQKLEEAVALTDLAWTEVSDAKVDFIRLYKFRQANETKPQSVTAFQRLHVILAVYTPDLISNYYTINELWNIQAKDCVIDVTQDIISKKETPIEAKKKFDQICTETIKELTILKNLIIDCIHKRDLT